MPANDSTPRSSVGQATPTALFPARSAAANATARPVEGKAAPCVVVARGVQDDGVVNVRDASSSAPLRPSLEDALLGV